MPNPNTRALTAVANTTPIPEIPKLPAKMLKLVPEMAKWQAEMDAWRRKAQIALTGVPGP